MQQDIDAMCEWAKEWAMQFNAAKCKVMHLGRSNKKHEYKMEGEKIAVTEEERDLGVITI